ncbi:site-specific recombinase [Collimonas fungivorans]|uniref:Putative site-specific recombinase putative membrane protein n=1 Tax=Collimonas fungivorans (strain Ter331) TaxID=1005048 RepID=G0A996_COLFT|nr:site-specific recombinase [Collimonas fungivorans]AEK62358.1 putative site-specific recombinase; putative membrane protein [Collimonas fungivorans Ter331]
MKILFLRLRVMWRRFRHGERHLEADSRHHATQVDALMRRANPFYSWQERANWIIDIVQWLRHVPKVSMLDDDARLRVKQQRLRFLLEWLDSNRDVRRVVQATLQKTLREAAGPELFCATGLPHEPAFFSELTEHAVKLVLPKPPFEADLSALFTALFPTPEDADWLLALDKQSVAQIWKLIADDGIAHSYQQQIDEALIYLAATVLADGISKAFRQKLDPKMPLQATPFMVLRRELETYLYVSPRDEAALRSVRMLIAVCQAQTDRIYAHLDEHGVSVSLVYRVERMRAQLTRMALLTDLRSVIYSTGALGQDTETGAGQPGAGQIQALLGDLIAAHHQRSSVRGLIQRSFSLLARKMVERNADHGEHYIARDSKEYRAMLKAAGRGGVITAFTVLGKSLVSTVGAARFFEGVFASLNYAVSFIAISAVGGVLATKQPAVTAPVLASKMGQLDTVEGLRALLSEIALLLRSQAAAVFGNLMGVVPAMLLISGAIMLATDAPMMTAERASASLHSLSVIGPTPLFAAFTGILLWLSSLVSGFADNWFALRRLREALTHQRRLVFVLGAMRAERWAAWLDRNVAQIAGNVSLGLLLGMTPVLAQFFGLPLDVRHVTLATGSLTAAASSLGWEVLAAPQFWLAVAGIASIAVLNVGVSFACALTLALRARDVPARIRRLVFRAALRRFSASPRSFLFPERPAAPAAAPAPQADAAAAYAPDGDPAEPVSPSEASPLRQRQPGSRHG